MPTQPAPQQAPPKVPHGVKYDTKEKRVFINTPIAWAFAFLIGSGLPVTPSNLRALVAWEAQEGGHWRNSRRYNPLNTTYHDGETPGYSAGGSQGDIGAYGTWGEGMYATMKTIRGHGHGYENILAALRKGNDAQAVVRAINASDWGTHGVSTSGVKLGSGYARERTSLGGWILARAPLAKNVDDAKGVAEPQGITGGAATGAAKSVWSAAKAVPHFLELLAKYLFSADWWKRIGIALLGLGLVIVAVIVMLGKDLPMPPIVPI